MIGAVQLLETELARAVNRVTLELRIGEFPNLERDLHTLLVNPTDISEALSSKNQTMETLGGNYTEQWGQGAGSLTLQGITGFRKRLLPQGFKDHETGKTQHLLDGYQEYKRIRKFVEKYLAATTANRDPSNQPVTVELRAHFWEDDEHLVVSIEGPEAFKKLRSDSRPLLYGYAIGMKVVGKVNDGLDVEAAQEAAGYQRAQAALQALSDANLEISRWLSVHGIGFPGVLKSMYDFAVTFYDTALSVQAQAAGFIQTGTVMVDLAADVFSLADMGRALIMDGVAGLIIDEAAMGLLRPVRRVVCAARNFATSITEADQRARSAASDVTNQFSTAGGGC